jgi:parallel beta-helix repeat protein
MAVIVVSNTSQLNTAMASARGGDTVVLKGGNYGNFSLTSKANFTAPVKIVSESDTNPAVFTGLVMRGVNNLKLEGVKFDYTSKSTDPLWQTPFAVFDSKNVSISRSTFDGDNSKGSNPLDAGFGTGRGLYVTGSTGVDIANNKFSNFYRGVVLTKSKDVAVSGNEMTEMSSDGINLSEVTNIVVQGNHIHDFRANPSNSTHLDMIQMSSGPTTAIASTNVKITDNLLDQGTGIWTQSIFLKNEAVNVYGKGAPLFYKDIVIENNIIRNGHANGISVGETIGVTIKNNTVLANLSGKVVTVPGINVYPNAQNVDVFNNLSNSITVKPKAGWILTNNYIVQNDNPASPDYIGNIFNDPLDKSGTTLDDFKFVPGNQAEGLGVGSSLSKYVGSISGLIINKPAGETNTLSQTFDASFVVGGGSKVNLAGAKVVWNFGDGKTAEGLKAANEYSMPGAYTAKVTITLANGKVVTADKTIVLKNANILDMDFENGITDSSPIQNVMTTGQAKVVTMADGRKVLDLNGDNSTVAIKTDSEFFNNTEYTFVADFKKDAGAEAKTGRLAYFGGSLVVSVEADGLEAAVRTSKGMHILKATALGIKDTDWHRVGVTFSGETGFAKLYLDGKEVASIGGLEGAFQMGTRAATFNIGGLFGRSFDGKIDNVSFFGDAMPTSYLAPDSSFSAKINTAKTNIKAASLIESSPIEQFVAGKTPPPAPELDDANIDPGLAHIQGALPSSAIGLDSDFRLI